MSFSQLVRQQMKAKHLSIRRISRRAEVDPSFFAKVLRGERQPPDNEKVLRRLAEALSLEPLQLLLSVGRLPAEWRVQSERPETLRALENLFRWGNSARAADREPSPPGLPERASSVTSQRIPARHSARGATAPAKKDMPPARVSSDLSEDLL